MARSAGTLHHASYGRADAQLEKAIEVLLRKAEENPRDVPRPPAYPVAADVAARV